MSTQTYSVPVAVETAESAPVDPSDELQDEASAEYDATERQRIPAILATEDGAARVTLIVDPCAGGKTFDQHLREYVRRAAKVRDTETDEEAVLAREEAQFAAAEALFDAVVADIEGLGDEDEKPDDWKGLIGVQEKRNAVDSAILFAQTVEDEKVSGKPSWKSLGNATTRLRCLVNGREVVTRHTLKKADSHAANEFLKLLAKASTGGQFRYDTLIFDLAASYDLHKIGARGYKGGVVPAHHKAQVYISHVRRQLKAIRKN